MSTRHPKRTDPGGVEIPLHPGSAPHSDKYCETNAAGECVSRDPRCMHNIGNRALAEIENGPPVAPSPTAEQSWVKYENRAPANYSPLQFRDLMEFAEFHAAAVSKASREELSNLRAELDEVDEALARWPVLADIEYRHDKILAACAGAAKAEERIRGLMEAAHSEVQLVKRAEAAEARISELKRELALVKRVLLQHMNDEDYEMSLAGLYAKLTEND